MSPTDPEPIDAPVDPFAVLGNERRRHALYAVARCGDRSMADVADRIARAEYGEDYRSSERKTIYVSLYQCHLDKLADVGLIEYDDDRKTIEPTDTTEPVVEYMLDGYDTFDVDGTHPTEAFDCERESWRGGWFFFPRGDA